MSQIESVALPTEIKEFQILQQAGVFRHVQSKLIPKQRRLVLMCADPFQWKDWDAKYLEFLKTNKPFVSTLKWFGGSLVVAKNSPVDVCHYADAFMAAIQRFAIDHFDMRYIDLYYHLPCGAAPALTLHQKTHLAIQGEMRVKKTFPQLTVSTFFHIAMATKKRTYSTSSTAWQKYIQRLPSEKYLI